MSRDWHGHHPKSGNRDHYAGFTLVELLVVIGIIALLISILLPSLNRAKATAQSVQCKALLRQWAQAALLYTNDNRDVMPDGYKYLDYGAGLARYMGQTQFAETLTRCPADGEIRLGTIGNYTSSLTGPTGPFSPDLKIRSKADVVYNPRVTIGINVNAFSNSLIVSSGLSAPRWLKPRTLRSSGDLDVTRIMTFADYQLHPEDPNAALLDVAAVRPAFPAIADPTKMGSVAFRHQKVCNVAFLDGHVGSIRATIPLSPTGLDMAAGSTWTPNPWPTGMTQKPLYKHSQLYYPFGPGYEGKNVKILGNYPTIQID